MISFFGVRITLYFHPLSLRCMHFRSNTFHSFLLIFLDRWKNSILSISFYFYRYTLSLSESYENYILSHFHHNYCIHPYYFILLHSFLASFVILTTIFIPHPIASLNASQPLEQPWLESKIVKNGRKRGRVRTESNRNKRIRNTKRVGFCLLKWVGAVFRRHENLCVGQASGNYAVDEMAGRKIERMVLESRGTSEQFACRSPIPPLPLLSFSSLQTNRNPSRVERESLREKFPLPFLFFFFLIQFILYRNPVTKRERLVYSNNRIFSKQDSGVDRESFEYSSVNFTVTGLRSRMYNSSAGLKLELFRFFPAIFFFRSLVKKNDESRSDPHLRFNIHIHD